MKNTKFLRVAALLMAVIMMMSFCLVSCDDGENAETTPADTTPAATTPAETTPADTTNTSGGELANPDADVSTAAGVAALLNANLSGMIPTVPEGGEQGGEQSGVGNIGNIGDIMGAIDLSAIDAKSIVTELIKAMDGMSLTVDNISGSLAEGQSLPEKFQLSNNFIYMLGKDSFGDDAKVIGKITADGISMIGSASGMVMPMTSVSFADIYAQIDAALASLSASLEAMPKVEIDVDIEAIKTALTVKEDDLIDLGNGVWQLKSTYVVNVIKTVLGELGATEAELGDAQAVFDLILVTNMTADLSKYAQTGELTIKLDIPQTLTVTVYSSATVYTVDVVAGEFKASLNATTQEMGGKLTLSVTELTELDDKEVLGATITVSDNGNKMTSSGFVNVSEADEAGNVTSHRYETTSDLESTETGMTGKAVVKCDGAELMKSEYTLSANESGMQFSAILEYKQNNLNASFTASMGASTELHVLVNDAGVETKADFVMNMADANGEIVKMSVTASGVTTFSFAVKAVSVDASGAPKFNIALVTPDGDISFDISTAAVAAPELTNEEKAMFELCDVYVANYATYAAQLADYDAKVEAALNAGKTLPMDFALIEKTNPTVVYHYYVFVYSAEEYEIDGFIELVPDTTGYNVISEADLAV